MTDEAAPPKLAASAPGCRMPGASGKRVHGFVNPPLLRGSTVLYPDHGRPQGGLGRSGSSSV